MSYWCVYSPRTVAGTTTLVIMTFSITTLSIMTLGMPMLIILMLKMTTQNNDFKHYDTP
jgi:hypothetical protein